MRRLMRVALLAGIGTACVGVICFFIEGGVVSPLEDHASRHSDDVEVGVAEDVEVPNRSVVSVPKASPVLRDLLKEWLFTVRSGPAGLRLAEGVRSGQFGLEAVSRLTLELLREDALLEDPNLAIDAPVATMIRQDQKPGPALVADVHAYVRSVVPPGHHRALQALLAGWPCFDAASCQASVAAAIAGLDGDALWALLRELLLREGSQALGGIVEASLPLADARPPDIARITLVMEAMFSFSDPGDAIAAVTTGATRIGDQFLAKLNESSRGTVKRFGVWNSSMSAWAVAMRRLVDGTPSQADAVSHLTRLDLVDELLATEWPSEPTEANAFHRMMLEVIGERASPQAVTFLRELAKHGRLDGVRVTAFMKLANTQPIDEVRKLFVEVVAADPAAVHNSALQVGFYSAVDTARMVDSNNRGEAIRLFRQCLSSADASAMESQRYVLSALKRSPLRELAVDVERLALTSKSADISKLAAETALLLAQ